MIHSVLIYTNDYCTPVRALHNTALVVGHTLTTVLRLLIFLGLFCKMLFIAVLIGLCNNVD